MAKPCYNNSSSFYRGNTYHYCYRLDCCRLPSLTTTEISSAVRRALPRFAALRIPHDSFTIERVLGLPLPQRAPDRIAYLTHTLTFIVRTPREQPRAGLARPASIFQHHHITVWHTRATICQTGPVSSIARQRHNNLTAGKSSRQS